MKNIIGDSAVQDQVVVSLPPVEEFTEPMYSPVHHEQIVAGEITQNIVRNVAVQEQATVQEIPPDVEQIQEQIVETIDMNQAPRRPAGPPRRSLAMLLRSC